MPVEEPLVFHVWEEFITQNDKYKELLEGEVSQALKEAGEIGFNFNGEIPNLYDGKIDFFQVFNDVHKPQYDGRKCYWIKKDPDGDNIMVSPILVAGDGLVVFNAFSSGRIWVRYLNPIVVPPMQEYADQEQYQMEKEIYDSEYGPYLRWMESNLSGPVTRSRVSKRAQDEGDSPGSSKRARESDSLEL